jgi:tetratricopeptide (TPR) repeat protein
VRIFWFGQLFSAILYWPYAAMAQQALAENPVQAQKAVTRKLTAAELFAFADTARDRGDFKTAEAAYRALSEHGDIQLRTEARFRLGMMRADREHRYREAAVEFRKILDENPRATRVRLELARMAALLGEAATAQRELRAAAADGLPPDVVQTVRFYANALEARRNIGGGFEIALAPDNNVNRATRASSLSTVIGDFTLNPDAQTRSGVGLALRGQGFIRAHLSTRVNFLAQLSGQAILYRDHAFNDIILSPQLGPEIYAGKGKIQALLGAGWRRYGRQPYTRSVAATGSWQHPLGARSQLRLDGGYAHINNQRNNFEDGESYSLSMMLDHAMSARLGGGVKLFGACQSANDPGYANASGGISGFLYRDTGRTTFVLGLGYSHLEADKRLFLFPVRRIDDRFTASLGGTFRMLRLGSWAPVARVIYERNRSTLTLYDYSRIAAEFGLSAAF